ncbi:MAG: hypothetical protein RL095_730 [Verrucomicrobiota bacterium]|jgi:arylsulfatase A-like enzyme
MLRLILSALFLASSAEAEEPAAPAPKRPNIVFFLVDDMGWQDCSVPFHSERTALNDRYRTPNLEKLAQGSTLFTQAYASAVCSPSRISLMTGANAARHGVTCWTLRRDVSPEGSPKGPVRPPQWPFNGLCPEAGTPRSHVCAQTLPRLLAEAGYHCIHAGKAHWGATETSGADPRNFGFAVNIAGHAAGGPGSYWGEKNYSAAWRSKNKADEIWNVPGLEKYHGSATYLTEALTREALAALDRNEASGKPFYLYLSHYAVHAPFEADARFVQPYLDRGLSKRDAAFASMVEGMDKSLGELLAWLERHQHLDDTLILFMSDNGSPRENPRNLPLRGHKITGYEGGTRVPLAVRLPRALLQGRVQPARCADPVIIEDVFPSLLEAAGIDWKPLVKHPVDGRSFLPLARGDTAAAPSRDLIWHYPNTYDQAPWSSIRRGDLKLICHYASAKLELYDLNNDIGESRDLAAERPAEVRELAQALSRQLKERGALLPTRPDGPALSGAAELAP